MSGTELPVSKAAIDAAKGALGASESEKQQLAEMAKDSPAMQMAADSYAQRIAIKQGILLKLYQPLAKWAGASREYFEQDFGSDIAEKVADVPDENLTTPRPSVAVPAMQGLGYSLDEPTLKEMYLNLLATASDDRRSDGAHPSFAEIIRQLSPAEAAVLPEALTRGMRPIARLEATNPDDKGKVYVTHHILELLDTETGASFEEPALAIWIDNWTRLGLVEVDYSTYLVAEGIYDWVDQHPAMQRAVEWGEARGRSIEVTKGVLRPTDFGDRFAEAVTPSSSGG